MNQFFDYNNNVFRVLGGLADCLILGALWIVCSIPVVTMEPPQRRCTYAVNKKHCMYMDRAIHSGILHGSENGFETDHRSMAAWGILTAFLAADLVVTRQFLAQGSRLVRRYIIFYCTFCHGAGVGVLPDGVYGESLRTIRESMKKTTLVMVLWKSGMVGAF